ncbi:MAG: response regulator transcription factor, partial [Burkholderiaceae bacterium]
LLRVQTVLVMRKRALERDSLGIRHTLDGELVGQVYALPLRGETIAARLQTILRRGRGAPRAADAAPQRLVFDGLEIDLERRVVLRHGEPVELTGTEFELLTLLAREPQKVFTRDQILNRLRGHDAELYTRAVDILVSRLRKKLEPLNCIKTLRNTGYAFAGART